MIARLRRRIPEAARCRNPNGCDQRAGRDHLLCPDCRTQPAIAPKETT
jgi:hypothetical protein